jgi:hypothetical protein
MKKMLQRHPATSVAALLLVLTVGWALLGDVNVINVDVRFIEKLVSGIETHEIDDVLIAFLLLGLGVIIDARVQKRKKQRVAEIQAQRLRVLKATMITVQDIVNNFLNSLQLFRMEAEDVLPPESLQLFDELVKDTAARIKMLGDLDSTPETKVAVGIGIDYENGGSVTGDATIKV